MFQSLMVFCIFIVKVSLLMNKIAKRLLGHCVA
ncbi:Uncharacterised protein [Vibrio cholerae]|nr:Uncharacterised protein [Vibrio cholerae]